MLKTLVNMIRSYGSTIWKDHDVVRLMLRLFTVINLHLVNLIRENPRYTKMTPEEILRKFVSGRMMVKEARYVDDALNRSLPLYERLEAKKEGHQSNTPGGGVGPRDQKHGDNSSASTKEEGEDGPTG